MKELEKKKKIINYSRTFEKDKFSPIRSGNITIKHKRGNLEGFLISPSGKKNIELKTNDIVFVAMTGEAEKNKKPSSEWRFHLDLYKSSKCNAIVHAHSKFSVICSCLFKEIPSFHYMIALAGGDDIKCAEYATFGTTELSKNILKALEKRKACLMSNHGQVAFGTNLKQAFELAEEVENICYQYIIALKIGDPKILSSAEMNKILDKIKHYKKA